MLVGIDVGGTFTDGVLFQDGAVLKSTKKPTDAENIKKSLLAALDDLLADQDKSRVKRVVFSTTVVTNLVAAGRGEKTAVLLIPGPGLPPVLYHIAPHTYLVKGSIDFRGNVAEDIEEAEIKDVLEDIKRKGFNNMAVAAKFSNRNHSLEKKVRSLILKECPEMKVTLSSETVNRLNFPRRAVTTYYTAVTGAAWNSFTQEVEAALKQRNITGAVDILKADGGTMPLAVSRSRPCETIFSGPAASTMGALALSRQKKNAVVMDVGGTTTDISLLIDGAPLYASQGACLNGRYTHINSFALCSLNLGGDTVIKQEKGELAVGPERLGAAVCFGGPQPTVTDALNYKYELNLGFKDLSRAKLQELAAGFSMNAEELAGVVVDTVVQKIAAAVQSMFRKWENEPAYKVWEIVHKRKFVLEQIIGIGAAAHPLAELVAEKMKVECFLPEHAPVANALGACAARPTLALDLYVDTQKKIFSIEQAGLTGTVSKPEDFQLEDAKKLARDYLEKLAEEKGLSKYAAAAEYYREEQFNMIRGWQRVGRILEVGIQISPGLVEEYDLKPL